MMAHNSNCSAENELRTALRVNLQDQHDSLLEQVSQLFTTSTQSRDENKLLLIRDVQLFSSLRESYPCLFNTHSQHSHKEHVCDTTTQHASHGLLD